MLPIHIRGLAVQQHTGSRGSDSKVVINVQCSGSNTFTIGEFISNLQSLSIHSDGWFNVLLSLCWLVFNLSLFRADCEDI